MVASAEVNPPGPVHDIVNGPGLPPAVIDIAPLKGDTHEVLFVRLFSVIVTGVELSGTLSVNDAAQPRFVSVTNTS